MAVYKFKFGEVTVAEGLPPVSPELHQYIEELAEERFRACMQGVIKEFVEALGRAQLMSAIEAPPLVVPLSDEAMAKLGGPVEFKDDEAVA